MPAIGNAIGIPFKRGRGVATFDPFESKAYSVLDILSDGGYNTITSLAQHPININKVIMTYLAGPYDAHGYDPAKVLKMRISNDRGQTFGAASTIYDPGGILCVQEQHAGYSSDGRLHILATIIDDATPGICSLIYLYSDNDGSSFTVTDITSVVSDVTLPVFRNSGNLIENNGIMMGIIYRQNAGVTSSNRSILRLVAGTWTQVDIETTVAYENESSIVSLGGDNILLLVREDATKSYIQFLSANNGLTWTRQGTVFLSITTSLFYQFARPGQLHKFKMNGEDIIVMYMPKNASPIGCIYAIYARASNLLTYGINGWHYPTLKKIVEAVTPYSFVCHGDSLHYNDNYNAIDCWPFAVSDWSVESIYTFEQDTTDYATIESILFTTAPTEADAYKFYNAAAITDSTIITAVSDLVTGLKTNSLWTKVKAIYPMVGGTASTHKWNLKNPLDTNAAFRLTFVDGAGVGWVHSATGAKPDGTGAYADTHLTPSTDLTLYSAAFGFYSRTNVSEAGFDMGSMINNGVQNNCIMLRIRYTDGKGRFYCNNGYAATDVALGAVDNNSTGFTLGSRMSNADNRIFYRDTQSGTTNTATATNSTSSYTVYLGANNSSNIAASFTSKECALSIILDGVSVAEATILNTLVVAFETTLGRNV